MLVREGQLSQFCRDTMTSMSSPKPHYSTQDAEDPQRLDSVELSGLRPRFMEAFELLRRARLYALDSGRDAWDFAVEASALRRCGLTATDFRWMACKGYVLHGRETTEPGAGRRRFSVDAGLTFGKRSCFVITDEGLEFADSLSPMSAAAGDMKLLTQHDEVRTPEETVLPATPARPQWDCDSRELRYQGRLIKQFKVPSPNQEIVIMAFEEESWPTCITDPLPPRGDCDPKQRLHDTIRSLNRNQKNRLLRFKGNGTGQGVLWEPIRPAAGVTAKRPR